MANPLWVNADGGNDGNMGTSSGDAVEHISRALELTTFPLEDEQKIILMGDVASPEDYNYQDDTDECINLENLEIKVEGALIFEIDGWSESDYEGGDLSPIDATAGQPFDPTETKPCLLPPFKFDDGIRNVGFRGVAFTSDSSEYNFGAIAEDGSKAAFQYCSFEGLAIGCLALSGGLINLYNCHFYECVAGVVAGDRSGIGLAGSNYIKDCMKYGLYAFNDSNITIRWWENDPLEHFTTKIYTTQARRDYAAMKAEGNSTFYLGRPQFTDHYTRPLEVCILNEVDFQSPDYYGIVLESKSMLDGAKFVKFSGKDESGNTLNEGKPTVLRGQRVLMASGEGAVICP